MSTTNPTSDLRIGFYPGGLDRSTFDILWTCFGTLFFCTWTTVYLNAPATWERDRTIILRKLKWMLVTVLAPEVTTCMALSQMLEARRLAREMRAALGQSGGEWTTVHSFVVVMGGYEIRYKRKWMGSGLEGTLLLDAPTAVLFAANGLIRDIPSSASLMRTMGTQSDFLGKGLSALQIAWLLIHIISRASQQLPISELEVATVAVAFAATTNYAFWWHKPHDPSERVQLHVPRSRRLSGVVDSNMGQLMHVIPSESSPELPYDVSFSLQQSGHIDGAERGLRGRAENRVAPQALLRNLRREDATDLLDKEIGVVLLFLGAGSTIFCGIHCAAWNFSFPTLVELWMWRGASCLCLVSSLGIVCCLWISTMAGKGSRILVISALCSFSALYLVARVFIVFELFFSLRSMPEDLYLIQGWTRYFPRF
ncbi:hypothetical protein B0T16DRAFT_220484 [Cercophora newfieldiana]|uniref:Uncharacterized protein n=1 Tax=Cercophora newfieldiana TaxID=92897 RepID=A0AA40CKI3_9PEZI|nr:hypothetical protein B0T16DRAFT_220484 [Cercophora newfieldiana]